MFWIGLQTEGATVKWAKIHQSKKKIVIDQLRTVPLEDDVKPLYFDKTSKEEHSFTVISGLETAEVLLREIDLKIKDKRKILQSLPFQIESSIPFPSEEAVVAVQIFSEKKSNLSKISLLVTKSSTLASHIELWKKQTIEPDEISCTPAALKRFVKHFFPELPKAIAFHIGFKSSTVTCFDGDKILFSHAFPLGLELFFEACEKDSEKSNTADFSKISPDDYPFLYEATLHMQKEIDRVFSFLLKKIKEPCEDVILTGNFAAFPKFREFIALHLPEPLKIRTCPESESYDSTTLEAYAIPIGLALDGLIKDGHSIEFRKEEFSSPPAKKKKIKAFLSFAVAVSVLTCAAFLLEGIYLGQKKKQLFENFNSSLSTDSTKIKSLEGLESALGALEIRLKKNKTPYPLDSSLPNVAEVLAWLSTHPSFSTEEIPSTSIEIKKIKYDLIKHPKAGSTKTPYVGKVFLEFETSSPAEAEAFKLDLSKPSSLIDTKKELTWENQDFTYFVSFFLKSTAGGFP